MRCALLVLPAVLLAGCGYPGEPKPPALMRPTRVTDLAALEHGAKIVVRFTLPKETTEGLPLGPNPDVELRVGVAPSAWNLGEWESNSERVTVPAQTAPDDPNKPAPPITVETEAAKYAGKSVVIGVRVKGPKGHSDGWSNLAPLDVIPALAVPQNLVATNVPNAVHLQWNGAAPEFRIFRKLADEKTWTQIGTSKQAAYDDGAVTYGKTWQYAVQAVRRAGESVAESDNSQALTFVPKDVFPPGVPAGLAVVPGIRTVELVWDRVADADVAGYRVYRNGNRIADGVVTPAYSDKDVASGGKYRYEVSAVDEAGNESAKCAGIDAVMD